MAEVQQCETENPGQNLPDIARTAHKHMLYVAGGARRAVILHLRPLLI